MEKTEIEKLGASLRRIDRKLIARHSDRERVRVWYQGGEPYFDLFVELREQDIEWLQFTLRGRSLSWQNQGNRDKNPWQTGVTNELQTSDITFYAASKTIESDRFNDRAFLELVYAILKTRAGEPLFDRILVLFEQWQD